MGRRRHERVVYRERGNVGGGSQQSARRVRLHGDLSAVRGNLGIRGHGVVARAAAIATSHLTIAEADKPPLLTARCARIMRCGLQLSSRR